MEIARAAPSVGSVPAPNSSNRHREWLSAWSKIETIFVMWAEKVLRLCSILCSSPISAKTSSNTASSEPSKAGMWSPAWPIRVNKPTVFKETVFPPVLGPVTIRRSKSFPRWMLMGTTLAGSRRGWRPSLIFRYPLVLNLGSLHLKCLDRAALAKIKSSLAKSCWFRRSSFV